MEPREDSTVGHERRMPGVAESARRTGLQKRGVRERRQERQACESRGRLTSGFGGQHGSGIIVIRTTP